VTGSVAWGVANARRGGATTPRAVGTRGANVPTVQTPFPFVRLRNRCAHEVWSGVGWWEEAAGIGSEQMGFQFLTMM
jgi:hypothetical protein